MDERQQAILQAIVKSYIKTAEPVSSGELTRRYGLGVSPATIRNDMAELEAQGFIVQPHTSAGRVPTEKGYRFVIEQYVKREQEIGEREKTAIRRQVAAPAAIDDTLKNLARTLARISMESVIIGFGEREAYVAGLGNLFRQPEFERHDLVERVGSLMDEIEAVMGELLGEFHKDYAVLLGRENPFGEDLGTVIARYDIRGQDGLLCILGPIRMNYRDNIARLLYSRDLLEERNP